MHRWVFLYAFLSLSTGIFGQSYTIEASSFFGGPYRVEGRTIGSDHLGNYYAAGVYYDWVDFDPGKDTIAYRTTDPYLDSDIYISKYNSKNQLVWIKKIGGPNLDEINDMWVDSIGNITCTGFFIGKVDFDPGPDSFYLLNKGQFNTDIFIARYDSAGNFIWAKQLGGPETDIALGLAIDSKNQIYVSGMFSDTVRHYEEADTFEWVSHGKEDLFLIQLNSDGKIQWHRTVGGPFSDFITSLDINADGTIVVGGSFSEKVDFDPTIQSDYHSATKLSEEAFFSLYNTQGDYLKTYSFGGKGSERINSVQWLNSSQFVVSGSISDTGDFAPGPDSIGYGTIKDNVFIAMYDTLGKPIWQHFFKSKGNAWNTDLIVDQDQNILSTGWYADSTYFNGLEDTFLLVGPTTENIYFTRFNPHGKIIDVRDMGGLASCGGYGLNELPSGDILLTGWFSDTAVFDNNKTVGARSNGVEDAFILRLQSPPRPNLGPDTTICFGDTIHLQAHALVQNFQWNNSSKDTVLKVFSDGKYSLTYKFPKYQVSDSLYLKLLPLPTFDLGNDTFRCKGDSLLFKAPLPNQTYFWSTGNTSDSQWVASGVEISLQIADTFGCSYTDSVMVYTARIPRFNLGNDTFFCAQDSFLLHVNQFGTFNWSNGNTKNPIAIDSGDTYSLIITTDSGCVFSDSIQVTEIELPGIIMPKDTSFCYPTPLTIKADTVGEVSELLWNTKDTLLSIQADTFGTYGFKVTNAFGCEAKSVFNVHAYPLPSAKFTWERTQKGNYYFKAKKGYESYQWVFNSIDSSKGHSASYQLKNSDSVSVWCTTTNIYGCKDTLRSTVYLTGLNINPDKKASKINIYPNPNNGVIWMETSLNGRVDLYNSQGKKVKSTRISAGLNQWNVEELCGGVYILNIHTNGMEKTIRKRILIK